MYDFDKINLQNYLYRIFPPHRQFGKTQTIINTLLNPIYDSYYNDFADGKILYNDESAIALSVERIFKDIEYLIDKIVRWHWNRFPREENNRAAAYFLIELYNFSNTNVIAQYFLIHYKISTVDSQNIHKYPFNFYPSYILLNKKEEKIYGKIKC